MGSETLRILLECSCNLGILLGIGFVAYCLGQINERDFDDE